MRLALFLAAATTALCDSADDYYTRGKAKYDKGDYKGAIADDTKAIELRPGFAEAYAHRGSAKGARGDKNGAIADYTTAIQLKPDYASAYFLRSGLERAKGNLAVASAHCAKAIQLDSGFFTVLRCETEDKNAIRSAQAAAQNQTVSRSVQIQMSLTTRDQPAQGRIQVSIGDFTRPEAGLKADEGATLTLPEHHVFLLVQMVISPLPGRTAKPGSDIYLLDGKGTNRRVMLGPYQAGSALTHSLCPLKMGAQ